MRCEPTHNPMHVDLSCWPSRAPSSVQWCMFLHQVTKQKCQQQACIVEPQCTICCDAVTPALSKEVTFADCLFAECAQLDSQAVLVCLM